MSWLVSVLEWCAACADQTNATPAAVGAAGGAAAAVAGAAAAANAGQPTPADTVVSGPPDPVVYPGPGGSKTVDTGGPDDPLRTYFPGGPGGVNPEAQPFPPRQGYQQIDFDDGHSVYAYDDGSMVGTTNGNTSWQYANGQVQVADAQAPNGFGSPQAAYPVYDPNTGLVSGVHIAPAAPGGVPQVPWPSDVPTGPKPDIEI